MQKTMKMMPLRTEKGVLNSLTVAYQLSGNVWRGFVHPYNITTQMSTKEETIDALNQMRTLYEMTLKEEGFPEHLTVRPLGNETDRMVFIQSIPSILPNIPKIDQESFYAEKVYA